MCNENLELEQFHDFHIKTNNYTYHIVIRSFVDDMVDIRYPCLLVVNKLKVAFQNILYEINYLILSSTVFMVIVN